MAENFEEDFLESRAEDESGEEEEDDDFDDDLEDVPPVEKDIFTEYIIPDDDRKTSPIMTISEMVEAVGIRISQIEGGSVVFTEYGQLSSAKEIAYKELIDRKNPLIISRTVKEEKNKRYVEHWKVREMVYPKMNISLPTNEAAYQHCS
jgi:hypothetical protein